jgi:glycogen debranching enzyme
LWPHDNAIIALGAKRYGYWEEANTIAKGIVDAASAFRGYRLPELFAGLQRYADSFPAQYLGANIPQAWAAGSIFMLLQAILGLRADMPARRVTVAPTLPEWLPEITLSNMRVGDARVTLRFEGAGPSSTCRVLRQDGDLRVEQEAVAGVLREVEK